MRRLAAVGMVVVSLAACGGSGHPGQSGQSGPTSAPSPAAPTPSSTTTTVDPGLLPQTRQLPSALDPSFAARMRLLWQAITTGVVGVGLPAFFPLTAYEKVKALADPAADWQHRLIADYYADIRRVHASLGPVAASAQLVGVEVPPSATWVNPGEEVNRIGYWRVYDSKLSYTVHGTPGTVVVISLISWRGQWYVVHFRTPPT